MGGCQGATTLIFTDTSSAHMSCTEMSYQLSYHTVSSWGHNKT